MFESSKAPHLVIRRRFDLHLDTMRVLDRAAREWGDLKIDNGVLKKRLDSSFMWKKIELNKDEQDKLNEAIIELELLG